MRGRRMLIAAGCLLFIAYVLTAADSHSRHAPYIQKGITASHAAAQGYAGDDQGVHEPGVYRSYRKQRTDYDPEAVQRYREFYSMNDRYKPDDGEADYHEKDGYKAPKAADPAGQTYMLSASKRTLSRPASTTLRQLAESTPPLNFSRSNAGPQHRPPQGLGAAGPHIDQGQPQPEAHEVPNGAAVHTASYDSAAARAVLSFDSLSAFDQAYANGGNQRILEPPGQGLCVGNGYVLATVNTVLQVYDATTGQPLVTPLDHNTFYGFPAQINHTTNVPGPFTWSPSCAYDKSTGRWFHVVATVEVNAEGMASGSNTLDIAVSDGPDPTGAWTYYSISGANNGDRGTPDAVCEGGFCNPDYPQIAIWKHALIITANEASLATRVVNSAVVYAIDKSALINKAVEANTALVRTKTLDTDLKLDSLIAARQEGDCKTPNTFLVGTPASRDREWVKTLHLLSLSGTETLSSQNAYVTLDWINRDVRLDISYSVPPAATQKPGDIPFGTVFFNTSTVSRLDTLDARMQSVSYVDDKLYCAWGTAVQVGDSTAAGAAWAVIDPKIMPEVALDSGVLAAAHGNHLLYPYMAVRPGGTGVMALTISGPDFYPTAAYALLDDKGLGQLTEVTAGAGPMDGLSGYLSPDRISRFGDYAAATVDEHGDIWIASEYVGTACTVEEYVEPANSSLQYTCDKTRPYATNWNTRISQVVVGDFEELYAGYMA